MPVIAIEGLLARITLPTEGAPTSILPGEDALIGMDSNAFGIIAGVSRILTRAGASREYVQQYREDATAGDYDQLIQVSMVYLSGDEA